MKPRARRIVKTGIGHISVLDSLGYARIDNYHGSWAYYDSVRLSWMRERSFTNAVRLHKWSR